MVWELEGEGRPTSRINELPGLNLPERMLIILQQSLRSTPLPNTINLLEQYSLMSAMLGQLAYIDAGAAAMTGDIRRLVLASWARIRNTLVETTMYTPLPQMKNMIEDGKGNWKRGSGQFVISSPSIATFSFGWLVGIPVDVHVYFCLEKSRRSLDFATSKASITWQLWFFMHGGI